jgi:predicted ATPase
MGEPGLGKSRLFYEFKLLSLTGCLVLEAYSVSHGKATAYLPVIELLKTYFRIESLDDERTRREKVGGKVLMLDRSLEDTLPYLFALLGIEEQPSPLQQMDAQIRRRRTFEALKKLFLRESLNQPSILIFEDLHWIDEETQGFLDVLSESVASAKLLSLTGCLVLEAYSVSHGKATAYLPVIELLKSYFRIESQDDERTRREKVGGKVLMLDRSLEDSLPYLFSLLGIEDHTPSLQQMDPQIRRRRMFDAIKRLLLRESLNQPLMLIFEDLHWIDLLLTNYRPEYRHEWGSKTYYTQLRLAPLGKEEAEELFTFLLGTDPSLKPLKLFILAKTEGTPFFMEEVVQTLTEEKVLLGEQGKYRLEKAPTELHISPTVQGVLAARIDRLTAEEKALLQQVAVIGRE